MRDGVLQICVLMGNIFTKHPMEVLRGLTVSAMEQGINLTVLPGAQGSIYDYWNATSEEAGDNLSFSEYNYQYNALYDYALIGGFDAIIITYGTLMMFLDNDTKGDFFSKFGDIPLVILQDYNENDEYCYLICENYQGMFNVVEHLIEAHGRRKILYLSGPKMNTEASERLRGYFDAVRSHGLDISLDMIAYGDYSQDVEPQVEELLNKNPDADAIACANDEMAMAVYRVCRRRGIVIGRDISITGFDDVEQAATLNPPLTTARQDGYQLGRMALELAIKRIKGEANNGLHTFPTPLVVRGSCGCDFNILDSSEGVLSLIDGFGEHFREDGYISRAASAIAADSMMYMYSPDVRKACEEFFTELMYLLVGIMEAGDGESDLKEISNSYKQLLRVKLDFSTRDYINWSMMSKYYHRLLDNMINVGYGVCVKHRLLHRFMEMADDHIEAMLIQTSLEQRERMEQSYIEAAQVIQRLKERVRKPEEFFKTCMQQIVAQGAKSAYFLIGDTPIVNAKDSAFTCPERLHLVAYSRGEDITVFSFGEDKVVTQADGFTKFYPAEKNHMYITFLLFSEEEQYGLLVAEITPEQLSAMHGVSMQLGNGMSIMSLAIKEDAAKSELNKTLRELKERNKILNSVSSNDPMTGVYNRRGFMEKALEINRDHDGEDAYLFFCDLDHLKEINDVFGHADGDYAITTLSQVLSDAMGKTGCCGRIGGDEFIAITACEGEEAADIKARVKEALARINETSGKPYYIECSMGYMSFICNEDVALEDVIRQADEVMYKDKQKRRASIRR